MSESILIRCRGGVCDKTNLGRAVRVDLDQLTTPRAVALIGVSLVVFFLRLHRLGPDPSHRKGGCWVPTRAQLIESAAPDLRSSVAWALKVFRHESL